MTLEPSKEAVEFFLSWIFGFSEFRDGQWEGVERSLRGEDSLVLMPTGHGKSLIYQLVGMLRPGNCVVIDPIVSLMDDQRFRLQELGIARTCALSSQLTIDLRRRATQLVATGCFNFVFVSPERFQVPEFRDSLRAHVAHTPIAAIVVDEAHCVSEWGHDFRTAYLNIARIAREHTISDGRVPPLLALTGTASRSVLKDVRRELDILDFDAVITPHSFDRKELHYSVIHCHSSEKPLTLRSLLQSLPDRLGISHQRFFSESGGRQTAAGLIFCPNVNGEFGVVSVANELRVHLRAPLRIYSGTSPKGVDPDTWNELKRGAAEDFTRDRVPILVATKAFGMGIDKQNVRYTIHYGIPASIESFYQEAGRAGRDRQPAVCAIICSNDYPQRNSQLLSPDHSIEQIAAAVDAAGFAASDDVMRNLFFLKGGFQGAEIELQHVMALLDELGVSGGERRVTVSSGLDMGSTEKALHRLLTIGLVRDYTIDYSSKRFIVVVRQYDSEHIIESFGRYVRNYQESRGRKLEQQLGALLAGPGLRPLSFVIEACRLLIEFIYDTVELGRRRALLEMLQLCAPGVTEELIRRRILSYLERSEFDEALEELLEEQEDTALVSGLLEEVVSANHAQSLRGQLIRFLESYPDAPNLLLLRGVVESMVPEVDPDLVIASFEAWGFNSTEKFGIEGLLLVEFLCVGLDHVRYHDRGLAEAASFAAISSAADTRFLVGLTDPVLASRFEPSERRFALAKLVERVNERLEGVCREIGRIAL